VVIKMTSWSLGVSWVATLPPSAAAGIARSDSRVCLALNPAEPLSPRGFCQLPLIPFANSRRSRRSTLLTAP